jgi:hypothetical protein
MFLFFYSKINSHGMYKSINVQKYQYIIVYIDLSFN